MSIRAHIKSQPNGYRFADPLRVDFVVRGSGDGRWFYGFAETSFDPVRYLVRGESMEDAYAWLICHRRMEAECAVSVSDPWFASDYFDHEQQTKSDAVPLVLAPEPFAMAVAQQALMSGRLESNDNGALLDTEAIQMWEVSAVDFFWTPNKPRIFAALYGGSSYSSPAGDDCEEFRTLADVEREWSNRRSFGRSRNGLACPMWGDGLRDYHEAGERGTAALVWFVSPDEIAEDGSWDSTDVYPSALLTIGPRGGLRFEHC